MIDCHTHLWRVGEHVGPFLLEESVTLEELASACEQGEAARYAHSAALALERYPALYVSDDEAARIRHGNAFFSEIADTERSLARVYTTAGDFLAIAEWEPEAGKWQPKKVFLDGEDAPK